LTRVVELGTPRVDEGTVLPIGNVNIALKQGTRVHLDAVLKKSVQTMFMLDLIARVAESFSDSGCEPVHRGGLS